jgi:hypothetical protein
MLTRKLRTILVQACAAGLITVAVACSSAITESGVRLGEDIPRGVPAVKLADVLADPAGFNDTGVVLQGVVASQCSTLCHFNFQDGVHSVTVYPQGFKLPRLPRGRGVTLFAHVYSGEGQVAFSVLGLHME